MSVFGLADSARICAAISPVPLCAWLTLMPVVRVNSAAAASHQGPSVLHSALTTPCAWEFKEKRAAAHANAALLAIFFIAWLDDGTSISGAGCDARSLNPLDAASH